MLAMEKFRPGLKAIALVPARAGSLRVKSKNTRLLAGHPLLAYTIAVAKASGLFDRIVCSTDSVETAEIAKRYGAEVPFLRPPEFASSTSPDIEWIRHILAELPEQYDMFSILRPTSPFRTVDMLKRAYEQFISRDKADSLRAVQLCKEHPGKMWVLDEHAEYMTTLLPQEHLEAPWHAGQYQALPKVYVQNSSLEIAWTRCVTQYNSREGKVLTPFLTQGLEGFTIDYEEDWDRMLRLIEKGDGKLPEIIQAPHQS